MANFNRGSRSGGPASSWKRRSFSDRGSRGPVQMHQAVCDNCGKNCEVPFRPTSGKPIFCNSCFENKRGSDSRGFESRSSEKSTNFESRQMFDAVCDNCGNSCKVPFQPSGEKPVYCSNCFGEKKGAGNKGNGQSQPQYPQYKEQFEQLQNKLDKILIMLAPKELEGQKLEEQLVISEEKLKSAKKKPSKKKE